MSRSPCTEQHVIAGGASRRDLATTQEIGGVDGAHIFGIIYEMSVSASSDSSEHPATRGAASTDRRPEAPGRGARAAPRQVVARHALLITLVLLIALFAALAPDTFPTWGNFKAIVGTQAVLLIVALAVTIPLAAGDFDLSIGFTLGFTMALVAVLTVESGLAWPVAVAVALAGGAAVGMVNGALIVLGQVNAFVVTLGTGTVLNGLALALTQGQTVGPVPAPVSDIARTRVLDLPLVTFYALALAVILWYVYEHTPAGRYLYFVGGGRAAARLAGVRVRAIRFAAFVAAAAICGVGGILTVGQVGSADPTIGASFLLPAYAAAFLGATTIKPGRFNAWGTVLALYLLATGISGLQLLGAPFWVEPIFNGTALTLAVLFGRLASRERDE